jgi:hypothetical protein
MLRLCCVVVGLVLASGSLSGAKEPVKERKRTKVAVEDLEPARASALMDRPAALERLRRSAAKWKNARDAADGCYWYRVYGRYPTGEPNFTQIIVDKGRVVQRDLYECVGLQPSGQVIESPKLPTWSEKGAELGQHDDGAAPLQTVDDVYADAEQLLSQPLPEHHVRSLEFDGQGILRECLNVDVRVGRYADNADHHWIHVSFDGKERWVSDIEQFESSLVLWERARDLAGGSYRYSVDRQHTWKTSSATTITVKDGQVVAREYQFWEDDDRKLPDASNRWMETERQIGAHGDDEAARAITFDDLYAETRRYLKRRRVAQHGSQVRYDEQGLLKCRRDDWREFRVRIYDDYRLNDAVLLQASQRRWQKMRDTVGNSYSYELSQATFTGAKQTTTVAVRAGKVVQRRFAVIDVDAANDKEAKTEVKWVETGDDVGGHQEGAAPALTLDERYAAALALFGRPNRDAKGYLLFDGRGWLTDYFVGRRIISYDCPLTISSFQLGDAP